MTAIDPLPQTLGLFAGIGIVLLVATLIGYVLKVSIAHGQPHGTIDNLNTRIRAWWVMVILAGFAILLGRVGVMLLFLCVSVVALREFVSLTCARGADRNALPVSYAFVLPTQYLLIYVGSHDLYLFFVPVYAFLILPVAMAVLGDTQDFLLRATKLQWSLMICVYFISYVPALLTLDLPGYGGRNLQLIVFLVVVVQSSDVLQYVWGKLAGRRKVAPFISPSKTWEGLIGGVASATAVGAMLYGITPFAPWQAALMALAVNVMGFFGGLVMSAIKRDCGAKDWGRMIGGHGGVLDRLDSVAFAAPVFFLLTRYGWS